MKAHCLEDPRLIDRFNVSLSDVVGNAFADELAGKGALLAEPCSIDATMLLSMLEMYPNHVMFRTTPTTPHAYTSEIKYNRVFMPLISLSRVRRKFATIGKNNRYET